MCYNGKNKARLPNRYHFQSPATHEIDHFRHRRLSFVNIGKWGGASIIRLTVRININVLAESKNSNPEKCSRSTLAIDSNQLTVLDVSRYTALTVLCCHDNQLTTLDVSHNTALVRVVLACLPDPSSAPHNCWGGMAGRGGKANRCLFDRS